MLLLVLNLLLLRLTASKQVNNGMFLSLSSVATFSTSQSQTVSASNFGGRKVWQRALQSSAAQMDKKSACKIRSTALQACSIVKRKTVSTCCFAKRPCFTDEQNVSAASCASP